MITLELYIVHELFITITKKDMSDGLTLAPLKQRHERKTFATPTFKVLSTKIQYCRRVLKNLNPTTEKQRIRYESMTKRYEHFMKVRKLLNRAVQNLYK